MEWQVRYEPQTREEPWNVYKTANGRRIFEQGFLTEDEALSWAEKERQRHGNPAREKNKVDEASKESFPASDPPAWIGTTVYKGEKDDTRKQGKIH